MYERFINLGYFLAYHWKSLKVRFGFAHPRSCNCYECWEKYAGGESDDLTLISNT